MTTTQDSPVYNKNNPFHAKITESRLLNKEGSAKETLHIVLDIEGSDLTYEPGQSIGIFPVNAPGVVADVLELTHFDPNHALPQKDGNTLPLIDVLTRQVTLNRVNGKFVKAVCHKLPEGKKKAELQKLTEDKEQLNAYIETRDYVDVLNEHPEATFSAEEFVSLPGKIVPRLYSIASSIEKHPNEVHLTVAIVRYHTHGRDKKGLATGYLADHTELHVNNIPVFFAPSKHFKLPEDPDTPIIMVGPGTGIAPFRAFLEQREIDRSKGKNWLFFGDQRTATDFLYQEEIEQRFRDGLLTRFDTAFSRDQEKKLYVQDRMREHGAELYAWLEEGSYFYVCGDASRMANDVNQALKDLLMQQGNMTEKDADAYLARLKKEKRYLRDVY